MTNNVTESSAKQQRCLDKPGRTHTLGLRPTHTTGLAGNSNMIGADSKCQATGQISCVMMRNREAV